MTRQALLRLLAWLLLLIAALLMLRGTPIIHDLAQFLPAGATREQQLATHQIRSGPASRLILIGLENAPTAALAETSQRLASKLRDSGLFSRIDNGTPLDSDRLGLEFRYRYLLDPNTGTAAFNEQALRHALQQRLNELSSVLPLLDRQQLAADPTGAFRAVLDNWQSPQPPQQLHGVWFSPDRQRALLMATMRASGYDAAAQQQAIGAIHRAFNAAQATSGIRLLLSGAPVFADSARNTIRASLRTLSSAAALLVGLFLLFVYRSPYLLIVGGLPIVTGLVAGSLATALLFGNLHGITLVFGITLLGVAIDYPIHLFSHLEPGKTPQQAMIRIWPTLRLGVITTCIGYLAFARQDFTGLAQLGVLTTCGLLTAALVTRWLLPDLLLSVSPPSLRGVTANGLRALLNLPRPHAGLVLAAALLTTGWLLIYTPPAWETDLAALSPLSSTERRLDSSLRQAIGAPDVRQLIVTRGENPEALLQRCERIAEKLQGAIGQGLLGGFDTPSAYLPSEAMQTQRQHALPDAAAAERQLAAALHGLPFRRHAFTPFLAALVESRTLPPLRIDDVEGTPTGQRIQPLLYSDENGWNALVLLFGSTAGSDFRDWWQRYGTPETHFIDLKQTSENLLSEFRSSALERLLLGVVLILLILSLGLRSAAAAFRVTLPVLLAISLTSALLGAMGERLSLFHLIALLLTAGIGIDYSLFFHRRESRDRARLSVAHALLVCAVSTVTVFALLAGSSIPVLHSIGITVTIGLPLCFLLALAASRFNKPGNRQQ
jgi:predicted exporter